MQRSLLQAYGLLLQLYPAAFRRRFGEEMLEVAAAAEPSEWPLIFSRHECRDLALLVGGIAIDGGRG